MAAIDVGTSTLKVSVRSPDNGTIMTERVADTPRTPIGILRAVERLFESTRADVVGLSSFRRALVIDDDTLSFARFSPPQPIVQPPSTGRTDAANRLAPIHRWAQLATYESRHFRTFDAWLAERLTGQLVVAESQAWLTGLWDSLAAEWDEAVRVGAGVAEADLPAVLRTPLVVDGICLPVLGDHEATAVMCANVGEWPLRLLECGTALACMIGGSQSPPHGLGIESPGLCGYVELIDPFFAQRVHEGTAAAPPWMETHEQLTAAAVMAGALTMHGVRSGRIALCGGNATSTLATELTHHGYDGVIDDRLASSAGALLVAERTV